MTKQCACGKPGHYVYDWRCEDCWATSQAYTDGPGPVPTIREQKLMGQPAYLRSGTLQQDKAGEGK